MWSNLGDYEYVFWNTVGGFQVIFDYFGSEIRGTQTRGQR